MDGDRLGRLPLPDQDLAQFLTCLDRAEGSQFGSSGVELAGRAEEVGLDDAGVGPGARVGFGQDDRLVDATKAGEGQGSPPVLELLVVMVGYDTGVLHQVQQFLGAVEKRVDEWYQEVGAVVPAEAGFGHGDRVVQSAVLQQGRGEPGSVPNPVVGGDGFAHHGLGLLGPPVVAKGTGVDVQDGVRVLSGGQLAQLFEPTMTRQKPGVGGESVLREVVVSGYVLTEDPDRFVGMARALQDLGLELLRVGEGVVPPALAPGVARTVGVRGD